MREKILSFLLKRDNIDFWELGSVIGYIVSYTRSLKEMKRNGVIVLKNNKIKLTEKGRREAKKKGIIPLEMPKKGKIAIKENETLLKKFKRKRKAINGETKYDQLQITPESVIDKVEVLREKKDLKGKKIICMGDDDLVGIALALTGLPEEVAVLDIDKSILDYEKKILKETKVKFKLILHSLVDPLPKEIKGKYDVFITEPPDTVSGNTLFFSRGVESLKEKGVGYLGISQNTLKREEIAQIERNILDMDMVITDIFDKFSLYDTCGDEFNWIFGLPQEISLPEKAWFNSNLVRAKALKKPKPFFKGKFKKAILETEIRC